MLQVVTHLVVLADMTHLRGDRSSTIDDACDAIRRAKREHRASVSQDSWSNDGGKNCEWAFTERREHGEIWYLKQLVRGIGRAKQAKGATEAAPN